jgi:hypothetical protein
MIIIDNTIVSEYIIDNQFVCDLNRCKGACCIEGDSGAPLEMDELPILEEIYEKVKPYLPKANIEAIEKQGLYEIDSDGDFCTTTVGTKECVFAKADEKGIWACCIEQAYNDGKIDFKKPISCHLYPIRITKTAENELLNYNEWKVCSPACELGAKLQVPTYKFLKEPLIRKYGEEWYSVLELSIGAWNQEQK